MHKSQKTLPLNRDQPYFPSRRAQNNSPSKTPYYESISTNHHKQSINTDASERIPEVFETLPSFGNEGRQISFGGPNSSSRSRLHHDFQNETLARRLSETSPTSLRSPLAQTRGSVGLKSDYGFANNRGYSASKDLKHSNSYINAMKALQTKVKNLEEQAQYFDIEKKELADKHKRDIEAISRKFDEERRSLIELENGLKNRLKLLEDDLRERDKILAGMDEENERIRKLGYESEIERTEELQKILGDKARLKDEYRDLNARYEDKVRAEEELKVRYNRVEYTLQGKDAEIVDLNERIRKLESDRASQTHQFEQKLSDLVIKHRQEEERRKDWEAQYQEEVKRRLNRDDEVDGELERLKMYIQELEDRTDQAEKRFHKKEDELREKNAQVLKLNGEVDTLLREQERARAAGDRAHLYAQDMAQINQRLITSMMEKSQGGEQPSGIHITTTNNQREYTGGFAESVSSEFPNRRLRSEYLTKTPQSAVKSPEITSHTRGWSIGSPKYKDDNTREMEAFLQGSRIVGDDFGSGRRVRSPKEFELRSGEKPTHASRAKSRFGESKSYNQGRSASKEDREAARVRIENEEVIKEIIQVEKEVLEWNREYQRLTNEMAVRSRG